jgi:hypothetical protein
MPLIPERKISLLIQSHIVIRSLFPENKKQLYRFFSPGLFVQRAGKAKFILRDSMNSAFNRKIKFQVIRKTLRKSFLELGNPFFQSQAN